MDDGLIHMWDMTHSYVRHDSFICETWLIHMWDMTHSYVRHDSFICETWLMTRIDAWIHDGSMIYRIDELHIWVTNYMYLSRTTYRWWIDDLSNRWRLHHRWSIQLTNVTYETRTTCMSLSNRRTTHMSHELHVWVYPIDEIHIWVTNYMYESIQ